MDALSGKKTYAIAFLLVLGGLYGELGPWSAIGDISFMSIIDALFSRGALEGFGLAAIRAGVAKS